MPKYINITEMQRLITEVSSEVLTSNDIVPRKKYPYFHSNPSVPEALKIFKIKLQQCRIISSNKVLDVAAKLSPDLDIPSVMTDFSVGSFSHEYVGSLVVAVTFGIGDCAECSSKLAVKMITSGYGHLTFLGIRFTKAQDGMEETHRFIVANLQERPNQSLSGASVLDFFRALPENVVIGDPFLGLSFRPNDIPSAFIEYIDAYGKDTSVIQCFHFINLGQNFLKHYLSVTTKVVKELKKVENLPYKLSYTLEDRIQIEDTSLIELLKEKTSLPFFGLRDDDYKVDAVTRVETKQDFMNVLSLQNITHGYGRFFRNKDGQRMFVLEGINIRDKQPNFWDYINRLRLF